MGRNGSQNEFREDSLRGISFSGLAKLGRLSGRPLGGLFFGTPQNFVLGLPKFRFGIAEISF